jgi:hypothetical protein
LFQLIKGEDSCDKKANSDYCYNVRYITSSGFVLEQYARTDLLGVHPAFYLNLPLIIFTSGDGTQDNPYNVIGENTNIKKDKKYYFVHLQ